MNTQAFMSEHIADIQEIIGHLERPFDSHMFIQKFAKRFQTDYVQLLTAYDQDPFFEVHKQIGKFLSLNQTQLGIKSNGQKESPNIFGEQSKNEEWI